MDKDIKHELIDEIPIDSENTNSDSINSENIDLKKIYFDYDNPERIHLIKSYLDSNDPEKIHIVQDLYQEELKRTQADENFLRELEEKMSTIDIKSLIFEGDTNSSPNINDIMTSSKINDPQIILKILMKSIIEMNITRDTLNQQSEKKLDNIVKQIYPKIENIIRNNMNDNKSIEDIMNDDESIENISAIFEDAFSNFK